MELTEYMNITRIFDQLSLLRTLTASSEHYAYAEALVQEKRTGGNHEDSPTVRGNLEQFQSRLSEKLTKSH